MDDRIQYKLFNLEVAPPENAWDNIESALNNEKSKTLIHRFNTYAVDPPADVWQKIDAELSRKLEPTGRVIRFSFKKLAAAALVMGIIGIASWLFNRQQPNESLSTSAATALILPGVPEKAKPVFKPANPNASPALQVDRIPDHLPVIRLSKPEPDKFAETERSPVTFSNEQVPLTSATQPDIYINAPAILGKDGQPVIDYQLLVSQNKNYITVTSPNGQQTRISVKFLPVLSYITGHVSSSLDSYEWKSRIELWKKKLLEDPNFIPAAGNFLDLPEMTDVFDEQ